MSMMMWSAPASALESSGNAEAVGIASLSFDLDDRRPHEKTIVLPDGNVARFGAEPVGALSRSLSGVWRVWGENGLAHMEYYMELAPSGSYTRVVNTWGLVVTGRLTGIENERINIPRRYETAWYPAIVEGYAKFNYLGNQWVSLWTQTGGVRAKIKNNVVTTELY